jgi:hypothetical protein
VLSEAVVDCETKTEMKDGIFVEGSDLVPEPNAGDTLRKTSKTQMQEQVEVYPKSMGSRKLGTCRTRQVIVQGKMGVL